MKKRMVTMVLGVVLALGLCACGNDEVKVITGNNTETVTENEKADDDDGIDSDMDNTDAEDAGKATADTDELKGYIFTTDGTDIAVDMNMADVLEKLGDPISYFEAASCAFQGLDKIYTYSHFEIDTYPDGENDRISSIIIKDDLISTPEGLIIGMAQEEMEGIYGTDYEVNGDMCVYTKDGMHLSALVTNGVISSIQYDSAVLDNAN